MSIVTSIPSESNCTTRLKSLVEGKFSAVSCSLGTYTKSSLQTLLKIHALREISKSIREEIEWLNATTSAPNKVCVSPSFLDDFKKLLLENIDGCVVVNDTILASDLMKLTGNKWLNLALVQGFVDLRNDYHSETVIFVLNDLMLFNDEKLRNESHFYGKQLRFITFIINVGGNIKETFVATPKKPGLHWTLLYVDTTQNKWFYCDTLGWAVPTDLTSTVNDILEVLSSELPFSIKPVQERFLAHKPQSMGHGSHQCTNTCFQNIPLQKCGNVCGVIVIVMAAISCISPRLWRLGFLDVKKTLSSQISWLKDPTSHSSYLRRVLVHWLISKDVDLKLLGITSSMLLAYNESPQEEGTSHGDTGSRAAPSFDKECGRPAKIVSNADKKATEERHPHTVEYVYSSDEEPYISLRKKPKADKNCYKNSTAPEIQNQPKAAEVKQEIEHHQSKSPDQDGHQKETSHTTEDYTEKESHDSNSPVMQESQNEKKKKETDEVTEIKPRKEQSKRSAISEFKDQQRTEKQDEVEVKTKTEHHHSNCPVIQGSRDERRTKTDEVTEIKPKKEQSKRSTMSDFKDQSKTEKQKKVEVKTKKEYHHLNCAAMQESQDEWQKKQMGLLRSSWKKNSQKTLP